MKGRRRYVIVEDQDVPIKGWHGTGLLDLLQGNRERYTIEESLDIPEPRRQRFIVDVETTHETGPWTKTGIFHRLNETDEEASDFTRSTFTVTEVEPTP